MLVEATAGERRALTGAAVALLALLAAGNSVANGFVWDDRAAVLGNRDARADASGGSLLQLLAHDFWGLDLRAAASHKSFRPLTVLSFRLQHALAGFRFHARAFHAANCAAHVACSLLVWRLARRLFGWHGKPPRQSGELVAALAAALFAVHPVHCDAVSSVVGRADLLCTLFALSSFIRYMTAAEAANSTRWGAYFAAIALAMASCVCKELGFTTFGLLFVYDLLLSPRRSELNPQKPGNRGLTSACVNRLLILAVVGGALATGRVLMNGEHAQKEWNILANSVAVHPDRFVRALSYAHIHAWYLWKLVWPRWLLFDYGFDTIPIVATILDPRNLLTLVAYCALLTTVGVAAFQYISSFRVGALHPPALITAIAFGVVPFIPASNLFFPVGTVVAERLLYLPSVGFCLLVALAVHSALEVGIKYEVIEEVTPRVHQSPRSYKRNFIRVSSKIIMVCCACAVVMGCLRSRARNTDWVDEPTLFESALLVAPSNVKVLSNTAKTLLNSDPDRALSYLRVAVGLTTQHVEAIINTAMAHSNKKDHLAAARYYAKAKHVDSSHPSVRRSDILEIN